MKQILFEKETQLICQRKQAELKLEEEYLKLEDRKIEQQKKKIELGQQYNQLMQNRKDIFASAKKIGINLQSTPLSAKKKGCDTSADNEKIERSAKKN